MRAFLAWRSGRNIFPTTLRRKLQMKISKRRLVSLFVLACGTMRAGNVVTDWNTLASTTIVTNGGKSPAPSSVWFAYSSIAVYDAVTAITGQYQQFYYRIGAPLTRRWAPRQLQRHTV